MSSTQGLRVMPDSTGWAIKTVVDDTVLYDSVLDMAAALHQQGLDLFACTLRTCLDAADTTSRQQHLLVELTRLSRMSTVRRSEFARKMTSAVQQLQAITGVVDVAAQPLYDAMRGLIDHLELAGAGRWVQRLHLAVHDPTRTTALRMQQLTTVLAAMTPGAVGLPLGSANLVQAVLQRLTRQIDDETTIKYLEYATRVPRPPDR